MNLLIIAAHPDDEVLGCGGSIAVWSQTGYAVHVVILAEGVTSRDSDRDQERHSKQLLMLKEASAKAGEILGVTSLQTFDLPDNRMDSVDLLDVVKIVEREIEKCSPDWVVTHHAGDLNIDHRIAHESVITACRPRPGFSVKRMQSFEVPSSTEWQIPSSGLSFLPNCYVDISQTLSLKMKALEIYKSEMRDWPHPRSFQAVEHLARWRGSSIGCEAAEAFQLMREVL